MLFHLIYLRAFWSSWTYVCIYTYIYSFTYVYVRFSVFCDPALLSQSGPSESATHRDANGPHMDRSHCPLSHSCWTVGLFPMFLSILLRDWALDGLLFRGTWEVRWYPTSYGTVPFCVFPLTLFHRTLSIFFCKYHRQKEFTEKSNA